MEFNTHKRAIVPYNPDLLEAVKNFDITKSPPPEFTSLAINQSSWGFSGSFVKAAVFCGHDGKNFGLIFLVEEPHVLGTKLKDFENVYEDSCVEFFFNFKKSEYWNFEFNCLGSCLCAKGNNREDRQFLSPEILASVYRKTSLELKMTDFKNQNGRWNLKLVLPLGTWLKKNLKGNTINGNFYKCGDKLKTPHYLSWNPVNTQKPDFHRPEHFGKLIFQ